MGGAAAQYIFRLLPKIGPRKKFREIRPDERCAGDDSAGNEREIRAIDAIGDRCRFCAHAGSKRDCIAARMAAEDKIQRIGDQLWAEEIRERFVQEIVFKAHPLDIPARAPDMRTIGDGIMKL